MRVRVQVEGEGPPLLLLNGLTRPLESWHAFTAAMSGHRVISFDVPGTGGSPTPAAPLTMSLLACLASGVLDAAHSETADVVGFSLGGAIAQQLAVQAPHRVRRLVLASTSCGIGGSPALWELRPREPDPAEWPRPNTLGTLWNSLAIFTWSSIPFLGSIRCPTLVVSGARDRVVPLANSRLLARRIPGAQLVVLPSGHDLQRVGAVDGFVTAVALSSPSELRPHESTRLLQVCAPLEVPRASLASMVCQH